jgi:uncharacterized membrane-anchored protein
MDSKTPKRKKVPDITKSFWGLKILSTAMGEALSDFLVNTLSPVLAVFLGTIGLAVALYIQLSAKQYTAWKYWLTVSMVAIFGTMAADVLHIALGIAYIVSTITFAIALAIIFGLWYRKERTLSIHSIMSTRREIFYWLTVGATFALGTATGDLTASTLKLGYLVSGILFFVLILIPFIAYFKLKMREVVAFWIAYILTRPLGASFADWLGKSHSVGGIGLGDGFVAAVLIVAIIALVTYSSKKRTKQYAG